VAILLFRGNGHRQELLFIQIAEFHPSGLAMSALQMEAEKERGKLDMAPGFLAVPIVYDKVLP
jgi:hypothetical protein